MLFASASAQGHGAEVSRIPRWLGPAFALSACLWGSSACSTKRGDVGGESGRAEKASEPFEDKATALEVSSQSASPPEPAEAPPRAKGKVGADWNDSQVAWLSPKEGFAKARRTMSPICLVVFTTWCPHCTAYSHLFKDPRIVEASKTFVMIRVDADQDEALSGKYALDGDYIPRTLFLSSEGKPDTSVRASSGEYGYYYEETDPAPLLAAMQKVASRAKTDQKR